MGPVRQNPIQRTVRTAHLSMLMTVHNFSTQYSTERIWKSALLAPDNHHSSDVVYRRGWVTNWVRNSSLETLFKLVKIWQRYCQVPHFCGLQCTTAHNYNCNLFRYSNVNWHDITIREKHRYPSMRESYRSTNVHDWYTTCDNDGNAATSGILQNHIAQNNCNVHNITLLHIYT